MKKKNSGIRKSSSLFVWDVTKYPEKNGFHDLKYIFIIGTHRHKASKISIWCFYFVRQAKYHSKLAVYKSYNSKIFLHCKYSSITKSFIGIL